MPPASATRIAARITGPAKTAFTNARPPPAQPEARRGPAGNRRRPRRCPPISPTPRTSTSSSIADTDFLDDRFWVQVQNGCGQRVAAPFADNGALLMNAAENMMGRPT